jgi:hypothetical protein
VGKIRRWGVGKAGLRLLIEADLPGIVVGRLSPELATAIEAAVRLLARERRTP